MKTNKILLLFIFYVVLLFVSGCEKKFDNPIENENSGYQVTLVQPSNNILFNQADSLITIRIVFSNFSDIKDVYCNIISSANTQVNSTPVKLLDNGNIANGDDAAKDGSYANKFPMSSLYPVGTYTIKYFVTDNAEIGKQVAICTFKYDNGQNNVAPVISDDIIEPDTVAVVDSALILTSIKATDANGLADISKVYFTVYRPDGTTNGVQNEMFDDGNETLHGDQIAGDGIYSLIIKVTSANAKGTYNFEFRAKDRGNKLSNIINHPVLIQ